MDFQWQDDDEDDFLLFDDEEKPKPKSRAGRKPGGKNTPIEQRTSQEAMRGLFERIENHLTPEHRVYMQKVIAGKLDIDPVRELQLLVRYLALLSFTAAEWAIEDRKVTQDLAKLLGEHRMALKDLEEMQRRRREEEGKLKNADDLVDATRKSTFDQFLEIHSGVATE